MAIKVPRRQFDENGNPIWVEPPETKEEKCTHLRRVITQLQHQLTARFDNDAYQYTAKHREAVAKRLPELQRELAELEAES
jgi:hypothetical protein